MDVNFKIHAVFLLLACAAIKPSFSRPASNDISKDAGEITNDVTSDEKEQEEHRLARKLREKLRDELGIDEEENDDLIFQGDMRFSPEMLRAMVGEEGTRHKRKALPFPSARWENPEDIPYKFEGQLNSTERNIVLTALDMWSENTCLHFRPLRNGEELPHINFVKQEKGCWAHIGYIKDPNGQSVSLAPKCFIAGLVAHEIAHALSFIHEHSRTDRDKYVRIVKENINGSRLAEQFFRVNRIEDKGVDYDLSSVMHYSSMAFSKNGKFTIKTLDPLMQKATGQTSDLSYSDVKLANSLYCQHKCASIRLRRECANRGYQSPKDCYSCLCPDGFAGQFCEEIQPSETVSGNCYGGVHKVRQNKYTTIESPSYKDGRGQYVGGTSCTWKLQAAAGEHVRLAFVDVFDVACKAGSGECNTNWVEVRYKADKTRLGPRFCCNDRPSVELVSEDNEVLVMFRARKIEDRHAGFRIIARSQIRADIPTRSPTPPQECGGCSAATGTSQPACVAAGGERECKEVETVVQYCSFAGVAFICNREQRDRNCTGETKYCCKDSIMQGSSCLVPLWGSWSRWSACTAACGGCGLQTRRRVGNFRGQVWYQAESRPCNQHPCSTGSCRPASICRRLPSAPICQRECPQCCQGYQMYKGICTKGADPQAAVGLSQGRSDAA